MVFYDPIAERFVLEYTKEILESCSTMLQHPICVTDMGLAISSTSGGIALHDPVICSIECPACYQNPIVPVCCGTCKYTFCTVCAEKLFICTHCVKRCNWIPYEKTIAEQIFACLYPRSFFTKDQVQTLPELELRCQQLLDRFHQHRCQFPDYPNFPVDRPAQPLVTWEDVHKFFVGPIPLRMLQQN